MLTQRQTLHDREPVRVLLVDSHPLLRAGMAALVNQEKDMVTCGEADSITTTRAAVAELTPNLVIFDLNLDGADMIELIKDFTIRYPLMLLLVFSQCRDAELVNRALRAGARGYVLKHETARGVITAIRTVLDGRIYVSTKIAEGALRTLSEFSSAPENERKLKHFKLTDRELHVFRLFGSGLSTRQIAEELHLSVKTIETHREHIKQKLDLKGSDDLKRCATDWVRDRIAQI
jgi:DNA-binding NarL/FixJ family response regulator